MITSLFFPLAFSLSLSLTSAEEIGTTPSPDGKIETTIHYSPTDNDDDNLIFKDKVSHKEIGTFYLGGYSTYTKLLWSPDSKYLALQTHFTRHTKELFIFRITQEGIKPVTIQDYKENIYGRLGVLRGYRGYADEPIKWLGNDRLLISASGTIGQAENTAYDYEVEIQIIENGSDLEGWLEKITPIKVPKNEKP
jgi:hypothetical protein